MDTAGQGGVAQGRASEEAVHRQDPGRRTGQAGGLSTTVRASRARGPVWSAGIVAAAGPSTAARLGRFAATHLAGRGAGLLEEDDGRQERCKQCNRDDDSDYRTDTTARKVSQYRHRRIVANVHRRSSLPAASSATGRSLHIRRIVRRAEWQEAGVAGGRGQGSGLRGNTRRGVRFRER
jgi:hypothetical protein